MGFGLHCKVEEVRVWALGCLGFGDPKSQPLGLGTGLPTVTDRDGKGLQSAVCQSMQPLPDLRVWGFQGSVVWG